MRSQELQQPAPGHCLLAPQKNGQQGQLGQEPRHPMLSSSHNGLLSALVLLTSLSLSGDSIRQLEKQLQRLLKQQQPEKTARLDVTTKQGSGQQKQQMDTWTCQKNHFAWKFTRKMYMDMSQEPFCVEIYRKNAVPPFQDPHCGLPGTRLGMEI